MDFVISHTGIWFDIWVLLALILLIGVIVYFIVRRRQFIRREEELTDLLGEKYAEENPEEKMDSEIEEL